MRKLFLIAVPLLYIATILFNFVLPQSGFAYPSIFLLCLIGLGYMYQVGKFRHVLLGRIFFFSIATIIIGALFKLQHWTYGSLIYLFGVVAAIIIYNAHFIKKPAKQLLDWLKVVFINIQFIASAFGLNHWPYSYEMRVVASFVFLLLIAYFYWMVLKNKEMIRQDVDAIDYNGDNIFKYDE